MSTPTPKINVPGFVANSLGFSGPQTTGLRYWSWLGGDATQSKTDISGGSDGTIIGFPSYDANYLQCDLGTGGLRTNMPDSASMTMACVFRREIAWDNTSPPVIMGTRDAAAPMSLLYLDGTSKFLWRVYDAANAQVNTRHTPLALNGAETWEMVFVTVDDVAGATRLYLPGRAINETATYTGPRKLSATPITVGAETLGIASWSSVKVAGYFGWNVSKTPAQMDEVFDFVRARLFTRTGISITDNR